MLDVDKSLFISLIESQDVHRQAEQELRCALRREFGEQGPFWGRQYIFWHDAKPLTLIYEVFSPRLQRLLGPSLLL